VICHVGPEYLFEVFGFQAKLQGFASDVGLAGIDPFQGFL